MLAIYESHHVQKLQGLPVTNQMLLPKLLFNNSYPIIYLKGQIANSIASLSSISGRPLSLAIEIERSTDILNMLIEKQNKLALNMWKERPGDINLDQLLGLVKENSTVDARFPSLLEQIDQATLDIMFFGNCIVKDLTEHHMEWRRRNGGPEKSIMTFTVTDSLNSKLSDIDHLKNWNDYPVIKRYTI
jgi:hypothetical protein